MLFGMLSGAAPRPTTHAQPKAGSQTAHPKAITKAPNGDRHTSDNRALLNQKRRMRKSRTSEQWLKTEGGPMESTRVESRGRGATPTDLPTNKSKEISSLGSPAFNQLSQRAVDDDRQYRALLNQKRKMRKSRTSEKWLKTEGRPMESTRVESRGRGATPTDLPTNKSKEISSLGSPAFNQLSQRAVDDDMHASGSRALRNYKRRMRKKRTSEQWLKTEGGPMERA